jgi:hypothetical protein
MSTQTDETVSICCVCGKGSFDGRSLRRHDGEQLYCGEGGYCSEDIARMEEYGRESKELEDAVAAWRLGSPAEYDKFMAAISQKIAEAIAEAT